MKQSSKTKKELVEELDELREQVEATKTQQAESLEAEAQMWESQIALSALLNNLPGIAYRAAYDGEGRRHVEFVSGGCVNLTGHRPGALLEDPMFFREVLTVPEDRERIAREIEEAQDTPESYELAYRIEDKSGETA